jgi:hypothetical protein
MLSRQESLLDRFLSCRVFSVALGVSGCTIAVLYQFCKVCIISMFRLRFMVISRISRFLEDEVDHDLAVHLPGVKRPLR